MKEKELRLALVCFGGISLAIYMHGVTKEIWKLVRASKAYHAEPEIGRRGRKSYAGDARDDGSEADSETVYYDLLRQIGETLDIRILTDVIAGASAGGINGIFLARALAHDLNMDPLRELWLAEADMERLMRKDRPASGWVSKLARPLIRWAATTRLDSSLVTPAIARKFADIFALGRPQPPLDGPHLLEELYNAMAGMGSPEAGGPEARAHSLLPQGQGLDLFVTLTDFYGYDQFVPIHDPPVIREREHRHSLHFRYQRWPNGEVSTEFDDAHLPGLAFAARATAAFPGAFPPARIAEVDRLMARRQEVWTTRQRFLAANFAVYRQAGLDPERTVFLDGSVLNNKPFAQAMAAIRGRPAFRDVDRRIVYIEPHPEDLRLNPTGRMPTLLRTIRGALSDIPRNQPIQDELDWIRRFNERVRQLKSITDASRPQIEIAVNAITAGRAPGEDAQACMLRWRAEANARAAADAGYAYEGYLRLKVDQATQFIGALIRDICDRAADSAEAALIPLVLEHWCRQRGIIIDSAAMPRSGPTGPQNANPPAWVRYLAGFDVEFRRRRLRFVIRALNQMYGGLDGAAGVQAAQLDGLKERLYHALDSLRHFGEAEAVHPVAATEIRLLFNQLEPAPGATFEATAQAFAEAHLDEIGQVIAALSRDIDLRRVNAAVDAIFIDLERNGWPDGLRRELLLNYLGFSFWDVLTFSVYNAQDVTEYNEIRVDRISPNDAKDIEAGDIRATIKGIALAHFGAFFRRADRENDYLWGRLHGAERLIEIVYDAARIEGAGAKIDLKQMKKQAFLKILDAEEKHLTLVPALIAALRAQIMRI